MKYKEGEELIAEHYFSRYRDTYTKGVLTNKRLICISQSSKDHYSEENYPLSKLTSVRLEKIKDGKRSKVLGFAIVLGLIALIITANLLFAESKPDWESMVYMIPVFLIIGFMVRYGLQPDDIQANLVITQMGGTKRYSAHNDNNLQDFADEINNRLY